MFGPKNLHRPADLSYLTEGMLREANYSLPKRLPMEKAAEMGLLNAFLRNGPRMRIFLAEEGPAAKYAQYHGSLWKEAFDEMGGIVLELDASPEESLEDIRDDLEMQDEVVEETVEEEPSLEERIHEHNEEKSELEQEVAELQEHLDEISMMLAEGGESESSEATELLQPEPTNGGYGMEMALHARRRLAGYGDYREGLSEDEWLGMSAEEDEALYNRHAQQALLEDIRYVMKKGEDPLEYLREVMDDFTEEEAKKLIQEAGGITAHIKTAPPKNVKDKAKWQRAEEEAKKSYPDRSKDDLWGVVNHIYQNMGGEFGKASAKPLFFEDTGEPMLFATGEEPPKKPSEPSADVQEALRDIKPKKASNEEIYDELQALMDSGDYRFMVEEAQGLLEEMELGDVAQTLIDEYGVSSDVADAVVGDAMEKTASRKTAQEEPQVIEVNSWEDFDALEEATGQTMYDLKYELIELGPGEHPYEVDTWDEENDTDGPTKHFLLKIGPQAIKDAKSEAVSEAWLYPEDVKAAVQEAMQTESDPAAIAKIVCDKLLLPDDFQETLAEDIAEGDYNPEPSPVEAAVRLAVMGLTAGGKGPYPAGLKPPQWVPWSMREIWRYAVERAIEEAGGDAEDPESARAALGEKPYARVVPVYKAVLKKYAPTVPVSMPHEYSKIKKPWEEETSPDVQEALGEIKQLASMGLRENELPFA